MAKGTREGIVIVDDPGAAGLRTCVREVTRVIQVVE
jgi:hypothetical protein